MRRMRLRLAVKEDCRNLWLWRNNLKSRRNFFNTEKVPWREHKNWFLRKLKDPKAKVYIGMLDRKSIGVMRFQKSRGCFKASVSLNPELFGQGLGTKLIGLGTKKLFKEISGNISVQAEIKKNNAISQRAFAKSGYKPIKEKRALLIYEKRK